MGEDIQKTLTRILVTQERHNTLLKEHMRRSDALEEALEIMRKDVVPLKTHVAIVGAMGKIVAFAGSGLGMIFGLIKLARMLGH